MQEVIKEKGYGLSNGNHDEFGSDKAMSEESKAEVMDSPFVYHKSYVLNSSFSSSISRLILLKFFLIIASYIVFKSDNWKVFQWLWYYEK